MSLLTLCILREHHLGAPVDTLCLHSLWELPHQHTKCSLTEHNIVGLYIFPGLEIRIQTDFN